jgi:hypothetical protein
MARQPDGGNNLKMRKMPKSVQSRGSGKNGIRSAHSPMMLLFHILIHTLRLPLAAALCQPVCLFKSTSHCGNIIYN